MQSASERMQNLNRQTAEPTINQTEIAWKMPTPNHLQQFLVFRQYYAVRETVKICALASWRNSPTNFLFVCLCALPCHALPSSFETYMHMRLASERVNRVRNRTRLCVYIFVCVLVCVFVFCCSRFSFALSRPISLKWHILSCIWARWENTYTDNPIHNCGCSCAETQTEESH